LLLVGTGQLSRYEMDDCRIGFTFSVGEGEVEIFLFTTASNRALRLTQPIPERVQGVLSRDKIGHSVNLNYLHLVTKVKKVWMYRPISASRPIVMAGFSAVFYRLHI
jgi:hypothetical protein